jgi:hypothetical protein
MLEMNDDDLDKLMSQWASQETDAAPELRPTAGMIRSVAARKNRPRLLSIIWPVRWAAAGMGLALLGLLIALFPLFFGPSLPPDLAGIGTRQSYSPGKDGSMKGPPVEPRIEPGKGKGPLARLQRLELQYQQQGAALRGRVDILRQIHQPLALASDDNYRLLVQFAQPSFLYVYQLDSNQGLIRLFPNSGWNPEANPLSAGITFVIPAEPNWLHLDKKKGKETLLIVVANGPKALSDSVYESYASARSSRERKRLLASFLESTARLERQTAGDVIFHRFEFENR